MSERDLEEVELDPNSPEYMRVKSKFLAGKCQASSFERIVRIEHKYMWQQYQTQKLLMERQNPQGTQNERELWHGTKQNTAKFIIEKGYDRSFVNVHRFGCGVYFAVDSKYSGEKKYARPDANGVQRMFLNKVLTGIPTQVKRDDCYLPARIRTNNEILLFDSAVDNLNNITMYVIFNDTQAYPQYLIEFKA